MDRALTLVQRAHVTDDELATVLPLYERAARQTGNDQQLLDALSRRAHTSGATSATLREGYDLATALHDDERAEAMLSSLVDFSGGDTGRSDLVWGLIELGKRRRARGDFDGSYTHLARALEHTDPERVEPHLRRLAAEVRERSGDNALVARIYETLRARVPGNAGLWNELFELYARIGDLASCDRLARERLEQLVEVEARTEVRMRIARLHLSRDGADPTALEALRDTLMDDPCHLEAGKLLARHYEAIGDIEALADLREGQMRSLDDRSDHLHAGQVAAALGRAFAAAGLFERAVPPYRRALEAAPGNHGLVEEILTCLQSTLTIEHIDLETRAEMIGLARSARKAVDDDPSAQARALIVLASLLANDRESERASVEAIQLLTDALTEAGPKDHERLAEALADLRARTAPVAPVVVATDDPFSATPHEYDAAVEELFSDSFLDPPVPDGVVLDELNEITNHD